MRERCRSGRPDDIWHRTDAATVAGRFEMDGFEQVPRIEAVTMAEARATSNAALRTKTGAPRPRHGVRDAAGRSGAGAGNGSRAGHDRSRRRRGTEAVPRPLAGAAGDRCRLGGGAGIADAVV